MAKYRQVHTTFWDDGFVIDLTPEEKYFYLYLMTNNNTTQCGIYELPYRVIEMQTGYNRDTVIKLLARFQDYGKILYNEGTKEIMLLNWARYNFINSPKVKKCVEKELALVKHLPFVYAYHTALERSGYSLDTVSKPKEDKSSPKEPEPSNEAGSIPYQYPMDSPCIDLGEEEEKEEEKEEEREEKISPPSSVSTIIDNVFLEIKNYFIQHVIHEETSYEQNLQLGDMVDDYKDASLIIEAMKVAVDRGRPKLPYVKGILRSWRDDGITSIIQLQQQELKKRSSRKQQGRQEHVPDWYYQRNEPTPPQASPSQKPQTIDFEAEREKILKKLNA
ncbi:DnaD domain protein [Lysinibacillus sp. KU-BSD001]|uniref:DnaD domain-containing protein n=1 Tax=Lysinibacillus sp. KU-BSD001 TaxID=3141328 RepID=UPI0036DFCFF0